MRLFKLIEKKRLTFHLSYSEKVYIIDLYNEIDELQFSYAGQDFKGGIKEVYLFLKEYKTLYLL